MIYRVSAACSCDTGRRRSNNEDNFFFGGNYLPEDNRALEKVLTQDCTTEFPVSFGVFDGMGGQADGQIASFLAAKTLSEFSQQHISDNITSEVFLKNAIQQMTDEVWNRADESFCNMGTTAAILRLETGKFVLCNVGDSRIFQFRNNTLKQISVDHTDEDFLKENKIPMRKPSLTQYIGISPDELTVEPYLATGELCENDQFLICSDGLTDMVSENEIQEVLAQSTSVYDTVTQLVKAALGHGGRDNITVILIQISTITNSNCYMNKEKIEQNLMELTSVLASNDSNYTSEDTKEDVNDKSEKNDDSQTTNSHVEDESDFIADTKCCTDTNEPIEVCKRNAPVSFVAFAIVVCLCISYAIWNYFRTTAVVPELSNISVAEADNLLSELGFLTLSEEEYNDDVEKGNVIIVEQTGHRIKRGSEIIIHVSKGHEIIIPNTVGKSADEVISQLENEGMVVKLTEKFSDSAEKGIVIAQSLQEGKRSVEGDSITLTVSKGLKEIKVDNYCGMSFTDAKKLAEQIGLVVKKKESMSPTGVDGIVVKQSLNAGTLAEKGDKIQFVVIKHKPITWEPSWETEVW